LGGGGLVVCKWGELGLERRRRNRGGEGRWSGHILTFTDGFTDGISVGETVDDSDGTIDTSLHGSAISNPSVIPSAVAARAVFLNLSVIPSEKITRQNLHVSDPFFFYDGNISVRNSVGNNRPKLSVGSYRLNYGRNIVHR
jgi:hypothetical protein